MSLWLLAASSKGFKKGMFLDNKDVSKSSGVSKGERILTNIEKDIWIPRKELCVLVHWQRVS